MTFEEKVQSMTAKEIIMAMIEALTHPPIVNIDMDSFGHSRRTINTLFLKRTCYGCAATNTICKIAGIKFTPLTIKSCVTRSEAANSSFYFMDIFEDAIDCLRRGYICGYNNFAARGKFAMIKELSDDRIQLPCLEDDYTNQDLQSYEKLANQQ